MMVYNKVDIDGVKVSDNKFVDGSRVWLVTNLIERSKDLEPFDLPLEAIYSGSKVWDPVASPYDIAHHVKRAMDVNPEYPIIMCQEGFIMDGWHRVLRALIEGKPTIKAVRFKKTPEHDYEK